MSDRSAESPPGTPVPGSAGVGDDGSAESRALSSALQIPLVPFPDDSSVAGVDFLLCHDGSGALCLMETATGVLISADFESGSTGYRRRQAPGKELLVKAVGGTGAAGQSVLDATAGLGRDAILLATAGFMVTLVERSVVVASLLRDALSRAACSDDWSLRKAASRMDFHEGDAIEWMRNHQVDVVYLDPMFPPRRKSARVRKEMHLLGKLLADDGTGDGLLEPALEAATRRVVVKRPRLAPCLADCEPDWQITGRSGRFDVYSVLT